jgi:hypothetical protein
MMLKFKLWLKKNWWDITNVIILLLLYVLSIEMKNTLTSQVIIGLWLLVTLGLYLKRTVKK